MESPTPFEGLNIVKYILRDGKTVTVKKFINKIDVPALYAELLQYKTLCNVKPSNFESHCSRTFVLRCPQDD